MQQQIHITPDQIPALLAQNREQLAAVNDVVTNKTRAMDLLSQMKDCLVEDTGCEPPSVPDIARALLAFVEIQKIEYTQQLRALHAQQSQVQSLIHQLENPVSIPTMGAIGTILGNKPLNPGPQRNK